MSKTVKSVPAKPTPSTTDSGRVKVGSGLMRYAAAVTTKPATHDAGRVQIGSGLMRF